jgi:hypothetical protein
MNPDHILTYITSALEKAIDQSTLKQTTLSLSYICLEI